VYCIFIDDGDWFSTENAMKVPGENVYFVTAHKQVQNYCRAQTSKHFESLV